MCLGLHSYLNKQPHTAPQVPAYEANVIACTKIYKEQSATCHGLPNEPQSAVARGMFPAPPELFKGTGVTADEEGAACWKGENGIRLSGRPGVKGQLIEKQIWQATVLVKNADKIPEYGKK